jgi:WXXGXW repeat (2 copies)
MRLVRSSRWILLALLLSLVPASSFAGVFISVGFAPPVLPVYEQPPCPEPGWLWTPGYWAYGDDGYYWVPGSWVPAPYEGALWTPPYWGWSSGLYMFHPGYWGRHVGYYGGVNYGFGYMGIGFVGGEWHGREFAYNTAVVRVNRTVIRNTYVNETIVHNTTIVNNHVAYNGGPGGIRHDPRPEERVAVRDQHMAPTSFQQQHIEAARSDRSLYVKNNGGRPQTLAVERPLSGGGHGAAPNMRQNQPGGFNGNNRPESRPAPGVQNHQTMQPGSAGRTPFEQPRNMNQPRPATETRSMPQYRPAPEPRSAPQYRPAPEARPAPQHSAPQARPAAEPRQEQNHRPEQKEPRGH